jgi:hypothetical protein
MIPAACHEEGVGHGLLVYDEFRSFLMHVRKEYAAPIASLVTEKLERGVPIMFARKKDGNAEVDIVPENFVLSFIASTTTPWLLESMRSSDMTGGMLSRFLLIESHKKNRLYELPPPINNDRMVALSKILCSVRDQYQKRTEFGFTRSARKIYSHIYRDIERSARKHGHPEYPSLVSRCPLYVKKLALINAAMFCRGDNMIHEEDVGTAMELVVGSIQSCDAIVDEAVAGDGHYARNLLRVKKMIASRGKIQKRDLLRHSHMRVRDLDEVLDSLKEQGVVKSERNGKAEVVKWEA